MPMRLNQLVGLLEVKQKLHAAAAVALLLSLFNFILVAQTIYLFAHYVAICF